MAEWVAFDERAGDLIKARAAGPVTFVSGDALQLALACDNAIAVLPDEPGVVLIATVRRHQAPRVPATGDEGAVGYRAGGFLGLSDDPVFEAEEPPAAKRWWQKLLD